MKTYTADTPLNSASITPKKDFVILGGGQAAMDVTTTSARQGKFEARFYHKIFEEEIGRVRGHFGPLSKLEEFQQCLNTTTNYSFYRHRRSRPKWQGIRKWRRGWLCPSAPI
jgi:hypothetical protein